MCYREGPSSVQEMAMLSSRQRKQQSNNQKQSHIERDMPKVQRVKGAGISERHDNEQREREGQGRA